MIGVGRRKNDFSSVLFLASENETSQQSEQTNAKRNLYELVTMSKVNVIYQQQHKKQPNKTENRKFLHSKSIYLGQQFRSSRIYKAQTQSIKYPNMQTHIIRTKTELQFPSLPGNPSGRRH